MTISKFTRPIVEELRDDLKVALHAVEQKHGIVFQINTIRFSDNELSTRLQAGVGTDTSDIARNEWNKYAWEFGLKAEDFGKTIRYAGESYTVVGINPRSRQFPVIVKNVAGKKYKLPAEVVK